MKYNFKVWVIARFTFLELYKSKILMNVLMLSLALLGVSYVATEFTYGVPSRVAIDFGLGVTTISSIAIAIFMGSSLLIKEVENRTLYMILSRPISRKEFLTGRVLGLLGILFVNILILMSVTLLLFFYLGGQYSNLLLWNFLFTYIESSIVLLVVILFSMVTNQAISIINTITVFICGHAISKVHDLSFTKNNEFIRFISNIGKYTLPDLSKLNIKNFLLYEKSLPDNYLSYGLLYGIFYCLMLLVVSMFIFDKKSFD
ncbi:ABC transporter permease [Halobacteriovorax sp. HLS]|uniref:ABC transporter permease n=1 Tax=Halobacteriovorax sp. HLS TaxID=2234000 RepID=UPI000FD720F4|nr:ABC transporter permease subunit [Halobacteriovorax sp. HLS]